MKFWSQKNRYRKLQGEISAMAVQIGGHMKHVAHDVKPIDKDLYAYIKGVCRMYHRLGLMTGTLNTLREVYDNRELGLYEGEARDE